MEKFDNNGYVIEDNVRELKGYDGVMDDVLASMFYEEEEEDEDPEVYDY